MATKLFCLLHILFAESTTRAQPHILNAIITKYTYLDISTVNKDLLIKDRNQIEVISEIRLDPYRYMLSHKAIVRQI